MYVYSWEKKFLSYSLVVIMSYERWFDNKNVFFKGGFKKGTKGNNSHKIHIVSEAIYKTCNHSVFFHSFEICCMRYNPPILLFVFNI